MIHIVQGTKEEYMKASGEEYNLGNLWCHSITDMEYLLEEHDGEIFMLIEDRLYELVGE